MARRLPATNTYQAYNEWGGYSAEFNQNVSGGEVLKLLGIWLLHPITEVAARIACPRAMTGARTRTL
jgi:hypothetical protein